MVGYLFTTEEMFDNDGFFGTESHFGVGGKWGADKARDLDGVVWQFQDTDFEADANLEGAHHVISIETADNAPELPEDILLWTPKQVESIVDLIAELCAKYDIPPVLIPDTKPGRRGLAYHAQGCTPNIVHGGERWSLSAGKVCPGPARIRQFKNVIIPAVQAKLNPQEDIMASAEELRQIIREELTSDKNIKAIAGKLFAADVIDAPDADVAAHPENPTWTLRSYLNRLVSNTTKETK